MEPNKGWTSLQARRAFRLQRSRLDRTAPGSSSARARMTGGRVNECRGSIADSRRPGVSSRPKFARHANVGHRSLEEPETKKGVTPYRCDAFQMGAGDGLLSRVLSDGVPSAL